VRVADHAKRPASPYGGKRVKAILNGTMAQLIGPLGSVVACGRAGSWQYFRAHYTESRRKGMTCVGWLMFPINPRAARIVADTTPVQPPPEEPEAPPEQLSLTFQAWNYRPTPPPEYYRVRAETPLGAFLDDKLPHDTEWPYTVKGDSPPPDTLYARLVAFGHPRWAIGTELVLRAATYPTVAFRLRLWDRREVE